MHIPKLKINFLTNLADARACAGWGIEYLGFSLERGSLYKISLAMLQQIVPWLSVPALVIDVGADISAIQEVENLEANCPIYIQLQNVSQKGENYILSLYEIPNSLYELSEEFAFLELRCAPPWPPLPTNCFINIDYCSIEEAITVKPFGISAGKVINSPNLQLDFDKLDNLRYRLGLECD